MQPKIIFSVAAPALLATFLASSAFGQIEEQGVPISFTVTTRAEIHSVEMPPIDIPALLQQDSIEEQKGLPFRFGYGYEVNYDLNNSGTWETLPDGSRLWRFRIACPGAYSINLLYDDFWLPKGARLFVYNENASMVIGAFTERNNKDCRQFATRPVKGDVTILEYHEPADVELPGAISIRRVVYGYKDLFGWSERGFGDAPTCIRNVNCPEGWPWYFQKRSVAMFIHSDGTKGCSGTLIDQDVPEAERRQYFLTANHCGGDDVATWLFYFNYESPVCPNQDGPTNMTVEGSELIAENPHSDFFMVRILEPIPASYKVYYSGWDARYLGAPASAVCIHHPRSDIKKITFFPYGALESDITWTFFMTDILVNGIVDHCSSGSPLYDANHRLIGQAWGAELVEDDACASEGHAAWFGKFDVSWDYGDTPESRLKDWLDPHNNGGEFLDGRDTYDLTGVVVLIDRTEYMQHPIENPRFPRARDAALADVNRVFDDYPTVVVAVMSFSSATGTVEHQGLTSDKGKVIAAINAIPDPTGGPSPLAGAMSFAADYISALSASNPLLRQLWVYTAGEEDASQHNNDSPVCGHCKDELAHSPNIDPSEWLPGCDPSVPGTCSDYQLCMAQAFIDNSIVNVGYFGSTFKQGDLFGTDTSDQPDEGNPLEKRVSRQSNNFSLLEYISRTSGGTFSFDSDVNQPPIASCQDVTVYADENCLVTVSVNNGSNDPDGDPITVQLIPPPPYTLGQTLVTLIATDVAGLADTCQATVTVLSHLLKIAKTHGTLQGQHEYIDVTMESAALEMGGFDILMCYDRSALNFQKVIKGDLYDTPECQWEYFTYRTWFWPSYEPHFFWAGCVRVVGIADQNDGAHHPSCFTLPPPLTLFTLDFLVTDNRLFECQFSPIRFFWTDCGDNTISSRLGDTLYVSKCIFEHHGFDTLNIADETAGFPTYSGIQQECLEGSDPGKPFPLRLIDFVNGGVDIICAESIDSRGDVNLNGVRNEIADAVVFTNYFIYGLSAFHVNTDGQTAATDVNADGLTLTVGDLVYLIRIIVGDALPYPKVTTPVAATYRHDPDGVLRVANEASMGAACVVVKGEVTPHLLASDMELKYAFDGGNTRMLVYSLAGHSFSGAFLRVPGEIVSVEMATRDGNPVVAELIPTAFALHQNHPNPFNPSTEIRFDLPEAVNVTLEVYNILGQRVTTLIDRHMEAGEHTVTWDASTVASGVYFYRITAGDFTESRKMLLLK